MVTTEDIFAFDSCNRQQLYNPFLPPRLPIGYVLQEALRAGLSKGTAAANRRVMELAASPGLALPGQYVYSSAVHHAHLIETIVFYLLGGEKRWEHPDSVNIDKISFQPDSWMSEGNRLRRVILCSRWDETRKLEESTSWRTVADICATGMPMTIHVIVIGSLNHLCYRPSVWTSGYKHRNVKDMRIKLLPTSEGKEQNFSKDWRHFYRETTTKSAGEWCKLMQWDRAFDKASYIVNVDVVPNQTTMDQMWDIVGAIAAGGRDEMRRSSCYSYQPCRYAPLCHATPAMTPAQAGWISQLPAPPDTAAEEPSNATPSATPPAFDSAYESPDPA